MVPYVTTALAVGFWMAHPAYQSMMLFLSVRQMGP
jgi:hypothetical protein